MKRERQEMITVPLADVDQAAATLRTAIRRNAELATQNAILQAEVATLQRTLRVVVAIAELRESQTA